TRHRRARPGRWTTNPAPPPAPPAWPNRSPGRWTGRSSAAPGKAHGQARRPATPNRWAETCPTVERAEHQGPGAPPGPTPFFRSRGRGCGTGGAGCVQRTQGVRPTGARADRAGAAGPRRRICERVTDTPLTTRWDRRWAVENRVAERHVEHAAGHVRHDP